MVRNRAHPEGSIAEAYIVKECLTFCSMYLHGIETKYNRVERNHDVEKNPNATLSVFKSRIRLFGEADYVEMARDQYNALHWFVLNNCVEIEPYLREHEAVLKQESPHGWVARQKEEFPMWFRNRIKELKSSSSTEVTTELEAFGVGPDYLITICNGCIVGGVKYLTEKRDKRRITQNSGVCTEAEHKGKMIKFYGVLEEVIELSYIFDFRCVLFRCKWYDLDQNKPVKIDKDFSSINVGRFWYQNDPYVLANQVNQVFYVNDTKLGGNWKVVRSVQHRHLFDPLVLQSHEGNEPEVDDAYQQEDCNHIEVQNNHQVGVAVRLDETPIEIEVAEKLLHPHVNNDTNSWENEEEEEDDTLLEYCSSGDEMFEAYEDSDLEY